MSGNQKAPSCLPIEPELKRISRLTNTYGEAGSTETVQALAQHGADMSLAALGGVTPLHAAAEIGVLPTVNALLEVRISSIECVCKNAVVCDTGI